LKHPNEETIGTDINPSPSKSRPGSGRQPNSKKDNIQRLVMEEVARVMRDENLRSGAAGGTGSSNKRFSVFQTNANSGAYTNRDDVSVGGGGADGKLESEKLTGLRYELLKIQQELLRRQVLDPKYYKATSVDTTMADNFVGKSLQPSAAAGGESLTKRYVPIVETEVSFADASTVNGLQGINTSLTPASNSAVITGIVANPNKGIVEVMHDLLNDNLLVRLLRMVNLDRHGQEIDPDKLSTGEEVVVKIGREAFAFMRVSKLTLNRITAHTLETVLTDTQSSHKLSKLENLLHQIRNNALQRPLPRGRMLLQVDRTLFASQLTANGVLAMLEIRRNDDCDGLIVIVTPTVNLLAVGGHTVTDPQVAEKQNLLGGPITLTVSDKELQVLLINQRSLYILAQCKWSCMEMVAQWLGSRIILKRVRVLDNEEDMHVGAADDQFLQQVDKRLPKGQRLLMTASDIVVDQQTMSPTQVSQTGGPNPRDSPKKSKSTRAVMSQSGKSTKFASSKSDAATNVQAGPNTSQALHADQDDDLSVDSTAFTQSSPANLNSNTIPGGKYIDTVLPAADSLRFAYNDPILLDLKLDRHVDVAKTAVSQWKARNIPVIHGIKIRLRAFQDLELLKIGVCAIIPHARHRKDESSSTSKLIDYSQLNENEEDPEEYFAQVNTKPTEINLMFQLTAFELTVFGANEALEDR
jgi:hypothetical protein